jgi:hypothetical protein
MAGFGSITGFLNKYLFGFALGTAAGGALRPYVQELENTAWSENQVAPIAYQVAALLAAKRVQGDGADAGEAASQGISGAKFSTLVDGLQVAPGSAELFDLYRRGKISKVQLDHGHEKASIEPQYVAVMDALAEQLLSSPEWAMAQQQGFASEAEANAGGALQGVAKANQQLRFEMAGLPPGVETALQMLRRGIIDTAEFGRIVREGHTKTKYTGVLEQLQAEVFSFEQVVEAYLKGWLTKTEADTLAALVGYTPEQVDLWWKASGRPAAPQQMATAVARGIDGPDNRPMDEKQFLEGIAESNIHPRWGPMLWGIRYQYPSLFQINRLVTGGAITPAVGVEWAQKGRYAPEVLTALQAAWSGGTATAGKRLTLTALSSEYEGGYLTETQYRDALAQLGYTGPLQDLEFHLADAKRIASWREKVVTSIAKSYVSHALTDAEALNLLSELGITGDAASRLVGLWKIDQDATRHTLTAAQVKRAYRKNILTQQQALDELSLRGYSTADATTYLAS